MKRALLRTAVLLALSAATAACSIAGDASSADREDAIDVMPTDGLAVLGVTVPTDFPIDREGLTPLPTPVGGSGAVWAWVYATDTDVVELKPGQAQRVRPGGCLSVGYVYYSNSRYHAIGDKDCALGLVAGQTKTIAYGAARVAFNTERLRVDFGRRAFPRLVDASGRVAYGMAGERSGVALYLDPQPKQAWSFNLRATGLMSTVAVPLRPGTYTLGYNVPGVDAKTVEVVAGQIAAHDATPREVRSTVHFLDEDASPLPQAGNQSLALDQTGVDPSIGHGYVVLATGGVDAKFFPLANGTDVVTYDFHESTRIVADAQTLNVPAHGSVDARIARIDVHDVAVTADGPITPVAGRWSLLRVDGATTREVRICGDTACTSTLTASGLLTQRGLYVPRGQYRATVTWRTAADSQPQEKSFDVTVP